MTVLLIAGETMPHEAWAQELKTADLKCTVVTDCHAASRFCLTHSLDVVVMDLHLPGGGVLALADLIVLRNPDVPIIPINTGEVFSDGCLFDVVPNARFMVTPETSGADLTQYVLYCASHPAQGRKADLVRYG